MRKVNVGDKVLCLKYELSEQAVLEAQGGSYGKRNYCFRHPIGLQMLSIY